MVYSYNNTHVLALARAHILAFIAAHIVFSRSENLEAAALVPLVSGEGRWMGEWLGVNITVWWGFSCYRF